MFSTFCNKISSIIDKHIPVKQLSKKERWFLSKPWITTGFRKSIYIKNNLYEKFLKSNSIYTRAKFKLYRNKLNHLLKISKRKYYNNVFENTNNSKKIWKGVKQIVHFKPQISTKQIKLRLDDCEITGSVEVANAFNSYFSSIGNDLARTIPSVGKNPKDYLHNCIQCSFFIVPTTSSEIEDEISKLKSGKSTGPFSISVGILKLLKTVLSKPLEIIFNNSFSSGIVPSDMKLANIIPVFKKGSQTCLSNYHPISLLSGFHKLQEKLMYNRLINFLENHDSLCDKQFGFRSKHNTEHAILSSG